MESKKTIFNYISDVFTMYGVIVFVYILLSLIVGDYVGDFSSLFRLGSAGLFHSNIITVTAPCKYYSYRSEYLSCRPMDKKYDGCFEKCAVFSDDYGRNCGSDCFVRLVSCEQPKGLGRFHFIIYDKYAYKWIIKQAERAC